jgi:hypothetical protein
MDPKLVRGQLQPGYLDPGGSWQAADRSPPLRRAVWWPRSTPGSGSTPAMAATTEGRTVAPLQNGAASLVLDTNGIATVGSWNQEVRMGPDVASVRQNLVMLVDNGQINPSCATGNAERAPRSATPPTSTAPDSA